MWSQDREPSQRFSFLTLQLNVFFEKSSVRQCLRFFFHPGGIKLKQERARVVSAGRRFFLGRVSGCGVLDGSPARVCSGTWGSDDADSKVREIPPIDSPPRASTQRRCLCRRAIGGFAGTLCRNGNVR